MHQKRNKILIYLSYLILFGSISNLNLLEQDFFKIKNINTNGLENNNDISLKQKLSNLYFSNIFFVKKEKIKKIINENSVVENFKIRKLYPSTLEISVVKTKFLALTKKDNNFFYIGSNSKLIKTESLDKSLPFIYGKFNNSEFIKIKKIIDDSKLEYNDIENFYFFPSKRLDLKLKNGLLIKLPEENIPKNMNIISDILKNKNFESLKIIDARMPGSIIINDK
tara:strand:+ start:1020 stop:1691 length:672 start_codon:yes stop_codon:yes gene_type:complete